MIKKRLTLGITFCIVILITIAAVCSLQAQQLSSGDPFESYIRILQLSDTTHSGHSFNLRPFSGFSLPNANAEQNPHPWQNQLFFTDNSDSGRLLTFYAPTLTTTYNSTFPSGQNDGALWQGRGLNNLISLGGFVKYGPFEMSIRPEFSYSQNRGFELAALQPADSLSQFAYPSPRTFIDAPQRYGNSSYSRFYPGQSYSRLRYKSWAAGISTENMWTGPAVLNPLMYSNNAPGFLHAFIGTVKPARTPIGGIEMKLFWGKTDESDFFDEYPENDHLFIPGIVFSYSPSFIRGLHIGGIRTYYQYYPDGGLRFSNLTKIIEPFTKENFATEDNPTGDDQTSQMLSLFGRWVHPRSGFELYAEWGRNDHSLDLRDASVQPEHSRAYMFGFLKRLDLPENRILTVNAEITQLERAKTYLTRAHPTWYQHHIIRHGFTNNGQVIGSGIGPGSNSQWVQVQVYDERGFVGLSLNRIEHSNDLLTRQFNRLTDVHEETDLTIEDLREVEFRFGIHTLVFLPNHLELQAEITQSHFINRYKMLGNNANNINIAVTLRYNLPGFSR